MQIDEQTRLVCAGNSNQGLVRNNNEDLFYYDCESGIFIVIDGVGGHLAGDKAAEIALGVLRSRLERAIGSIEERLREAITLANNEIYKQAQENSAWRDMSCVLTVAVVEENAVTVGHVGDTRLYQIQEGHITQLTHDHSFVGELVANGFIDEQEAMRHPRRNEITRDVGSNPHQPEDPDFIEISKQSFLSNSALLLCSDGLSDLLSSDQILSVVTEYSDEPARVVNCLINAAIAAGGKDNVTVVYVAYANTNISVVNQKECEADIKSTLSYTESHHSHVAALSGHTACLIFSFLIAVICGSLILWQLRHLEMQRITTEKLRRTLIVNPQDPNAYSSISEALQQAQIDDVVEVMPGDYQEKIAEKQILVKR